MIDLTEAKAVVEKLRAHKPYNAFTDGPLVLDAATIIEALVAEVEGLRAEVFVLDEELSAANIEMSELENGNQVEIDQAHARGVAEGVERAAKIAEARATDYCEAAIQHDGTPLGDSFTMRLGCAQSIATAIRQGGNND